MDEKPLEKNLCFRTTLERIGRVADEAWRRRLSQRALLEQAIDAFVPAEAGDRNQGTGDSKNSLPPVSCPLPPS